VILSIKQIVYTSTREKGETLLNYGEYNKNYLQLLLRRLQDLNVRQEQRALMAKLLSRISHLDDLGITNSLDYIEGYPQGVIYRP